MQNLIPIFILAVLLATVWNVFLKRFNVPTVIGYIFTGTILASLFEFDVHDSESLEHIAEFGVVFLMFTIGLEFSLSHIHRMRKAVFVYGGLQIILTTAVMTCLIQLLFDIQFKAAIIISSAIALSSTAIVLKILNETGKIKTPVGQYSLGILIFQDIAVIPILLMITVFTDTETALSELLMTTSINAALALSILIVTGKFVLGHVFNVVAKTNSKEIYMGTILLTVVGASYITHFFGFSYSLGGFIAGMMIADTIYKYQVEADLIPFRDLLLGVFFVSVGLQIDLQVVLDNVAAIVLLAIAVMLVKALVIFAILASAGDKRVAFKSAVTLAQIGEFALVVFSIVLAHQMIDPTSIQILLVMTILSMVMTPFLLNHLDTITDWLFKRQIQQAALEHSSLLGGHTILAGYGAFARVVSDELDKSNINHVIVTNNTDAYVKAKESNKTVVFGDPSDRALLERLQVRDAMSTILALDDFEEVKQASAAIALIDPNIKLIAKVPTEEAREQLSGFNHELLLDGYRHTAGLLVDKINRSRLLTRQTAELQFLNDYDKNKPTETIIKIQQEQARLLDIIASSFNALREDKDILQIKAFHDSFKVLSEIIAGVIEEVTSHSQLSPAEYEKLNTLLDNQHQLITLNTVMEELARELKAMDKVEQTSKLSHMAVEGLDAILLTLIDIAQAYNEEDWNMLSVMTSSERRGLSEIRNKYLGGDVALDQSSRALLLATTNHMDRLRTIFGSIGNNYKQLSAA